MYTETRQNQRAVAASKEKETYVSTQVPDNGLGEVDDLSGPGHVDVGDMLERLVELVLCKVDNGFEVV